MTGFFILLYIVSSCTCTCMYAGWDKGLGRLAGSDRLTLKFWDNLLTNTRFCFLLYFPALWLEAIVCFCFFELRTAMQCNFFSIAYACAYMSVRVVG